MIRFHPQILASEIHRLIANAGMRIVPDGKGGGLIVRRPRADNLRALRHPADGSIARHIYRTRRRIRRRWT